jgi:hypothetical protein
MKLKTLLSLGLSLLGSFAAFGQDVPLEAVGDQTINTNTAVFFDADLPCRLGSVEN